MKHGIGPGGEHLYPAFPYSSYQRMTYEDLIDLKAYLDTLPAVKNEVPPHELSFPFNIRRGLGLWQILYVDGKSFTPDAKANAELNKSLPPRPDAVPKSEQKKKEEKTSGSGSDQPGGSEKEPEGWDY